MKKITLLFCIFICPIHAGVSLDTVIETPEGFKEIGSLKVGDMLVCLDENLILNTRAVLNSEEIETESVIEITTENDTIIRVSPNQKVFIPYKWIQVERLSLGDFLLKLDQSFVSIKGICRKQEKAKLCFITVNEHHNFFASNEGILIHNGTTGASVGFWLGKFSVHFLGRGLMGLAAFCTGPAFWYTYGALEATFAGPLEATSNIVGIGTGIIGATLTGPV